MQPSDFSSANIGRNLQTAARVIAPLIALAITTTELAYWLGQELRRAIDTRNDQLAAWWVAVLGVAPASAPVPAPEPITTPKPIMIVSAPSPVRKTRTKKTAVAAPPAPPVAPAAPSPKRPRPARRAKQVALKALAA